mmetsp:Transcript_10876/g.25942  ORF Transcript_10876/g.25942 Transcript_10876/m.25942 type:complete len:334 (+) Transcript_10876:47-1048(+)
MNMMKAVELIVKDKTFRTIEVQAPTKTSLGPTEVLVKVSHAALDTTINSMVKQDVFAGFLHDMKSKPILVGYHYAGQIHSVGSDVVGTTDLEIGTPVFGHLQYAPTSKQGTVSGYIVVDASDVGVRPKNVAPATAAASATESITALQALRDVGQLKAGQKVLVLGAGGGVGSAAVGIAKSLGASSVTAVCSTKDVKRVKIMGADAIIDRKQTNLKMKFAKSNFDLVFDSTGKYSEWTAKSWIQKGGIFVSTLPSIGRMLFGWLFPLLTGRKVGTVMAHANKTDLELIAKWIDAGTLRIDVDSIFKASDFENAWIRHQDNSKKGRVVIQVEGGW